MHAMRRDVCKTSCTFYASIEPVLKMDDRQYKALMREIKKVKARSDRRGMYFESPKTSPESLAKRRRGKTPKKRTKPSETDPVEVYCRIRPMSNPNDDVCVFPLSQSVVKLTPSENTLAFKSSHGQVKETEYTFQHVFDESAAQKAVFNHVAFPLVEDLLHGKNGLLFTYGITGSGKTYTMTGKPLDQGILPRCLDVVFNSIDDRQARKYMFVPDKMNGFEVQSAVDAMEERQKRDILPKTPGRGNKPTHSEFADTQRMRDPSKVEDVDEENLYSVFVSYVELYNNSIYDLLEELPYDHITGYKPPQTKILREDANKNMFVFNCSEVEVRSPEEAFEVLYKGQKRRKVAHTALNAESSRSHSVFNIRLVQAPSPDGEEISQEPGTRITISQLSLVDLAGSERLKRTHNTGDLLKQAGSINQTLMVLRSCIEVLRENQKSGATCLQKKVPYREAKLTHLFKNYFDQEGKVRMIVCVNPKAEEYDETIHVMRFAELTQEVQVTRQNQVNFIDICHTPSQKEVERPALHMHVPPVLEYDLGPPFPSLELTDCSDERTLPCLDSYLSQQERKRAKLMADLKYRQDQFRLILVEAETENMSLRAKVNQLESLVDDMSGDRKTFERKIRYLEKENHDLRMQGSDMKRRRQELESQILNQDQKLQKEKSERERMKHDFMSKMEINNYKWSKNLQEERKRMQSEFGNKILAKERKLDMLKDIVNDGDAETPTPAPRISHSVKQRTCTTPATINGRVNTPRRPMTRATTMQSAKSMQGLNKIGAPTTPIHKTPIYNRRRRSKSTGGDIWLDHKPAGHAETDTVLQPVMKKKRSVTNLKQKDTRDVTKYCLTTQEQCSDGEVATKLVKGDVHPTAGGGTAVVFKDIETLKQTSPGDRKRPYVTPDPRDFEGDWTDVETRCSVAIDGHNLKRTKHSVI